MISIINPEFFRLQMECPENQSERIPNKTLINIFTDPKNIELPQYKKDPFASITINSASYNANCPEETILNHLRNSDFKQYSMYTDDQYNRLTALFDPSNHYHTLIFDETPRGTIANKNIVIAAIPCNGIIQPISKSNNYKLYNGSLVIMKNRPFKWRNAFYDKLVYLLIDLTTLFSFDEYVFTDDTSSYDYRKINHHVIGLTTNYMVRTSTEQFYSCDVLYELNSYVIPCANRSDREGFYSYSKKSMFYLSDIPNGIKLINGSIKVPLTVDDK